MSIQRTIQQLMKIKRDPSPPLAGLPAAPLFLDLQLSNSSPVISPIPHEHLIFVHLAYSHLGRHPLHSFQNNISYVCRKTVWNTSSSFRIRIGAVCSRTGQDNTTQPTRLASQSITSLPSLPLWTSQESLSSSHVPVPASMPLKYREECLGHALRVSTVPSSSTWQSMSNPSSTVHSSMTAKYTRLSHALSEASHSSLARVSRSLPRYGEVYCLTGASVARRSDPSGRLVGF